MDSTNVSVREFPDPNAVIRLTVATVANDNIKINITKPERMNRELFITRAEAEVLRDLLIERLQP